MPPTVGPAAGTLSASASLEALEDAGRDRAASTSTTNTGANVIDVERADSDMPLESLAARSHAQRRQTFTEYDQAFGEFGGGDEREDRDAEYQEEMEYLIAQVMVTQFDRNSSYTY